MCSPFPPARCRYRAITPDTVYLVGFRHIKPGCRAVAEVSASSFPSRAKKLPYEHTRARTSHLCRCPQLSPPVQGHPRDVPFASTGDQRLVSPVRRGGTGHSTWHGTGWQLMSPQAKEAPAQDGGIRTVPVAACEEQMSNQNSHCRLWCQDGNRDRKRITKPFIC